MASRVRLKAIGKALAVWCAILVAAIGNGAVREGLLVPLFGSAAGLVLSGVVLCLLILGIAFGALPWVGIRGSRALLCLGGGWLLLTMVFEFAFGLWQGKSLAGLLEAYTFRDGNIWPAVLGVTALAPYLAGRLRGWV